MKLVLTRDLICLQLESNRGINTYNMQFITPLTRESNTSSIDKAVVSVAKFINLHSLLSNRVQQVGSVWIEEAHN